MGLSRGLVYYTDGEGPLLAFDPDIWVAPTGGFASGDIPARSQHGFMV